MRRIQSTWMDCTKIISISMVRSLNLPIEFFDSGGCDQQNLIICLEAFKRRFWFATLEIVDPSSSGNGILPKVATVCKSIFESSFKDERLTIDNNQIHYRVSSRIDYQLWSGPTSEKLCSFAAPSLLLPTWVLGDRDATCRNLKWTITVTKIFCKSSECDGMSYVTSLSRSVFLSRRV